MEVYEYGEGRITQIKIDSDENGVFEEVHNSNINDDFNNYVESIEYYNNDTNEIYAKDNLMKEASFVISREEDTNNDGKFDKKIEYTYITSKAVDDCKNHQGQNENLSSEDIIRSNVGIAFIDKDGDGEYESLNF